MKGFCKRFQAALCVITVMALLTSVMPLGTVASAAQEEDDFVPVLRFMVTSDVHIRDDAAALNGHEQLANLYRTAYAYSESHPVYDKLDGMFFIGDNTQTGSAQQQTYFFNYLKQNTKEGTLALAAMGNHEFKATGQNYNDPVGATAKFLEYSGYASTDTRFELGGYQFIVMAPNRYNKAKNLFFTQDKLDWLKAELDAAVAETPDKPIFVMQHQPPYATMKGSYGTASDKGLKDVLVNYPQVIDFAGHTHCTLSDPRTIWQGEFTAINTGGLAYMSVPVMNGVNDQSGGRAIDEEGGWINVSEDSAVRNAGMYYIVEVDANHTVRVLTYNMFTESLWGEPYILDSIDPADFVYTDARKDAAVQPEFAPDAQLKLVTNNYKNLQFTIPQATCKDVVQSYRVEVYQGNTLLQTLYRLSGANYGDAAPESVKAYVKDLSPDTSYTVKVYATSSYNLDSEPLTLNVTTGSASAVTKADVLDVAFLDDGTAINTVTGEPLKTYGAPSVSYDTQLKKNVASFNGVNDAYGFWGISNWYDVISTSYTLETYAYLDKLPESGSMGILANLQSASIGFTYKNDGKAYLYSRLSSSAYTTLSETVEAGNWVHLTGTYDGSTLKYYINGVQVAEKAVTGTLVTPAYMARCMYLGADCNVDARETFFTGKIASAKLYTAPLTAAQVEEQYRLSAVEETKVTCPDHEDNRTWTPVGAAWANGGAIASGHYVLTEDIALTKTLTVGEGEQVCIDLAGYDITASGTADENTWYRVFENYGQLTILDSVINDGTISGGTVWNNVDMAMGGNIYNGENAVFDLYGGTIYGGVASAGEDKVSGSVGGSIYGAAGSAINIYGGRIAGGTATKQGAYSSNALHGGNIGSNGTVRIYGGTVIGGQVVNTFTDTGKTNNLSLYGGNIAMREGGQLYISGGMILDGLLTGTRTNNSGTCKAYGRGGNISANRADVTVTGGYIGGGKIQVTSVGKASGTTTPATASSFGGNIYIVYGKLNISGGTVAGGVLDSVAKATSDSTSTAKAKATSNGGNIYITEGVVANITGGNITGGYAQHNSNAGATDTYGGNIFVANEGVANITGGLISGGYSYYRGGNIGLNDGSKVKLGGNVLVKDGALGTHSSSCNGENVYAAAEETSVIIEDNAQILGSGGKASLYSVTNVAVQMTGGQVTGGVMVTGTSATNAKATFTMYGGKVDAIEKNSYISDENITLYNGILEGNPGAYLASCACYRIKGNGNYVIWHRNANDGTCATCGYDYASVALQSGSHTFAPSRTDETLLCHCGEQKKAGVLAEGTYYISLPEALKESSEGGKLQLLNHVSDGITVPATVTLDLNGFDLDGTVTVSGGNTLFVMDSQTDDYTVNDACGYGKLLSASGNVAPAEGYVKVTEPDGISFHKVAVGIEFASLRANASGIYYTGSFEYDEVVADLVASCGVTLSTENPQPVADDSDASCLYTVTRTSVLLQNIMSRENSGDTNHRNAGTVIYGRAYIKLTDGSYLYGDTCAVTLRQIVETIDGQAWSELTDAQKEAIGTMYATFKDIMDVWNIPNLKAMS